MVSDPLLPKNTPFIGQQNFAVRIVPSRRGMLVRHGDVAQTRLAFQAAAAVWGGARFPLLPVNDDGVVPAGWVQVAEVLGVQTVVDFTGSGPGSSPWTDKAAAAFHIEPAKPLEDTNFWNPHPLVVKADRASVRELYLPADDSLLSLAGAGGYGLDEEVPLFREHGWNISEFVPEFMLGRLQAAKRTAMYATMMGDVDTEVEDAILSTMGLLWVTNDPNNFTDALWFWNCRAVRPRPFFDSAVETFTSLGAALRDDFQQDFAAAVGWSAASTPSLLVASTTVDDPELRALVVSMGGTEHADKKVGERYGRPKEPQPLTFMVNQNPMQFWAVRRKSGRVVREVVQLRRPSTELAFSSPQAWVPALAGSGRVNIDITSASIVGPRTSQVAGLYARNGSWAGEALRLSSLNLLNYNFHIELPSPSEVLRAAVEPRGVTFERSDKGQQIIGAATRDPDLGFYRRRDVAYVIDQLTARVGRDLAREIEALRLVGDVSDAAIESLRASSLLGSRPARTASNVKSNAKAAGVDPFAVARVLDELVRRGAAQMGLVTKCSLCSLSDFQPLSSISTGAVCEGCGAEAAFARAGSAGPDVYYRLNSLTHSLSLNGGVAPLAALAVLVSEDAYVDPGVNLFRGSDHVGEVDILGWQRSSLFAGEAKMSAVGFEYADLDRDVSLAASIGADTYLAVCAEDLPEAVRVRLLGCTDRHGMTLRVMDRSELFEAEAAPAS